jgi:phage baseplate assembly protein W
MGKLYKEEFNRTFTNNVITHYSVDLSRDVINKGVVYDAEVIKQAITNIILTSMGERLFNLPFGTNLYGMIFNTSVSSINAQAIKRHVINKVLAYEKRVAINEEDSRVYFNPELNELRMRLKFVIKATAESAVWEETILL